MNEHFDETLELELANDATFDDGLSDLLWEEEDLYSLLGYNGDSATITLQPDRLAA